MVTEGQAEIIIFKFVNALSKKIGDFLSKTIYSTGIPIHIIIRKMLFFHTFISDSCSVGLLLYDRINEKVHPFTFANPNGFKRT